MCDTSTLIRLYDHMLCLCTHCHATFKVFSVGDFCANSYVIGVMFYANSVTYVATRVFSTLLCFSLNCKVYLLVRRRHMNITQIHVKTIPLRSGVADYVNFLTIIRRNLQVIGDINTLILFLRKLVPGKLFHDQCVVGIRLV